MNSTEFQKRTNINVGSFFILTRLRRKLRLEEMAKELGVSTEFLMNLETKPSKISLNKISKIVLKLNKNERVEFQYAVVSALMSVHLG